jgi:predicted nuclease of predicted toxin-antitoxin system
MALALQDERVLITEDKDFGELIFVRKLPHGPIVRVVELAVDEQIRGMAELLEHRAEELTGAVIVTITRGRIRIRRQRQTDD